MDPQQFTGAQVVTILRRLMPERQRLNYSLLNYYKRTGMVEPTGERTTKMGRTNRYTRRDLLRLAILLHLKQLGMNVRLGRKLCRKGEDVRYIIGPLTIEYNAEIIDSDLEVAIAGYLNEQRAGQVEVEARV